MKYLKLLICLLVVSGCSDNPEVVELPSDKVVKKNVASTNDNTSDNSAAPQLWSTHKKLDLTAKECALIGRSTLDSLGFTSVVQNKNYVYGVFGKNKAAVKCVEMDNISFVYISVLAIIANHC